MQNPAIRLVENYMQSYQYSLRALVNGIPAEQKSDVPSEVAVIGRVVIWPCTDGAVVLIYQDANNRVAVETKDQLTSSVDQFLRRGEAAACFDKQGNRCPLPSYIQVGDARNCSIEMAAQTVTQDTNVFRTRHQKALVLGWDTVLPEPDKAAKDDFDFVYIVRNVAGAISEGLPKPEVEAVTARAAGELLARFSETINFAEREEDVQRFLAENPQLIYPEHITCYPKWKLGDDWVTDFVFLIQGANGPEYVFVELEKPSKKIVTGSGQFSSDFTQAKDQLNNWERWITQNLSYAQQKLPGLFQPSYHLIFGRTGMLDIAAREKLRLEFNGTSKIFSTYDDIRDRFDRIMQHIGN